MKHPMVTVLALVGAGIVAAEVYRREQLAAGRREPFVGIAEIARRLRARLGLFESAVTGPDLRARFDPGFFGGFPGSPAPAAPGAAFTTDVDFEPAVLVIDSPGGGAEATPTFGVENTAPQDFTIAQFAAARVSATDPGVRIVTRAFAGDPLGFLAAIAGKILNATGVLPDPVAATKFATQLGEAAKAVQTSIRLSLGLAGIPSPGVPSAPVPLSLVTNLSLFLGRKAVEVEEARRAERDPTFRTRLDVELAAQRADPQRFFNVLADPKNPPPEITFSAPRLSGPDPDTGLPSPPATGTPAGLPAGLPAAPSSSEGPPGPGGPGETGGPPAGAPGPTGEGVPGGFTGETGGTVATGGVPGVPAGQGFQGETSFGVVGFTADPSAPAPAPAPSGEPSGEGEVSSDPSDSGDGGGGGGGGGVSGGGPGTGTGDAGGVSGP